MEFVRELFLPVELVAPADLLRSWGWENETNVSYLVFS